jgi:membrane protease YdiL (CAAX protease family)
MAGGGRIAAGGTPVYGGRLSSLTAWTGPVTAGAGVDITRRPKSWMARHWSEKYRTWGLTLGLGICCGILLELIELFVSQPILVHVLKKKADLSQFAQVHGNIKMAALYIVLVWVVAALGEELIYRGT